jgi:Fe-S-cluster containining protein
MEAIIFLILPTLVLVVASVLGFAFLKEAFTLRPKVASARGPELPLLEGDDLRRWAADRSKALVSKYTTVPWTRTAAVAAAREVEREVSRIIEEVSPAMRGWESSVCSERGNGPISLTVPETLAVAEELRSSVPRAQVRRALKLARANLEVSAGMTAVRCEDHPCPLLGDDGHCLVHRARPLQCRGRLRNTGEQIPPGSEAGSSEFAATVSEGMREGLAAALTASGLDGQCYELNGSLVEALKEA